MFKELQQEYSARADECLKPVKERSFKDREELYACLKGYVCCKYMLEPGETEADDFEELGQESISRVAKIPKGDVANKDISMSCAGISSVQTKKILLLIALKRTLDINIPPEASVKINSITDLTGEVEKLICKDN